MSWITRYFLPSSFLLLGLGIAFYPTFLSGFALIQGDPGDVRFNNYVLEHTFLWLTGSTLHQSFWQLPIFYPTPNTGAFSDLLLTVAPFYWLFRLLGLQPDTSFQCWLILMEILNYLTMFALLRFGFRFSTIASSIGAYFFTFANVRLVQFAHPQLVPQFYMLFAVYALLRIFEDEDPPSKKRSSWVFVFVLASVLQLYASVYLGWLFAFSLGVFSALAVVFPGPRKKLISVGMMYWKSILASGILAMLCVSPMAFAYYAAAKEVGYHDFGGVHIFLPPVWGWLFMGDRNLLYGWASKLPTFAGIGLRDEKTLGWGLIGSIMVLAGLTLWQRKTLQKLTFLYLLTILVLLTNLSHFGSLWQYFYLHFPSAGAIRAPGRIALVLLIPASIGVALCAKHLTERRTGIVLTVVISILLVAEQVQLPWKFSKQNSRDTYRNIVNALKEAGPCESFILTQQKGRAGFFKYHLDAMWASNLAEIPTLNGYSGKSPKNWPFMDVNFHSVKEQKQFRSKLKSWIDENHLDPDTVCWVYRNVWKPKEMYARSVSKALSQLPSADSGEDLN